MFTDLLFVMILSHFLQVKRVTHDGMCGFRSLSVFLTGQERNWNEIVDKVIELEKSPSIDPELRVYLKILREGFDVSKKPNVWDEKMWLTTEIRK